jgi:hypothetical protein
MYPGNPNVGKTSKGGALLSFLSKFYNNIYTQENSENYNNNFKNAYNTNSALFWELYDPPKLSLTGHSTTQLTWPLMGVVRLS